ncbi:hypothetical protein CTAYLR_009642 [Chrysophaeum taylorii]|uniref:Methyltransferase domain-containing protein n=1 Tax=Chrysophaeum taylorii TaxID=2483200 RepID=A0AAD7U5Z3_9STRA|nr:hypothetical protein CTAYLR_009642 [Chrysophaeum taylorii]
MFALLAIVSTAVTGFMDPASSKYTSAALSHRHPRTHLVGNHGLGGFLQAMTLPLFWEIVDRSVGYNVCDVALTKLSPRNRENFHKLTAYDLGCGIGRFSVALARQNVKSIKAIDASEMMLSFAKMLTYPHKIKYLQENVVDAVIDKCDLVVASFLMHELPPSGHRLLLENALRKLKSGGQMLVVDADPDNTVLSRAVIDTMEPFFDEYQASFVDTCKELSRIHKCHYAYEKIDEGRCVVWILTKF